MFVRNAWYAAGFSDEFGRQLVARTYLNEAVVLYRTDSGEPVAMEDRCAHRRLPLSMGRLVGDAIECAYHGLVYDCSGTCIKIPGQTAKSIPSGARVRAYPVVDRFHYLWIWMGDPALADPALLPDFELLESPNILRHRIHLHLKSHYQLAIDNLLDLSHLAYVHNTTTGNAAVAELATIKTTRTASDVVQQKRWLRDVEAPPAFARFGGYTGPVNMWQISEFSAPAYMRVGYGSSPASETLSEDADIWSAGSWGFRVFHGVTPETEKTTHQFRYVAYDRANVPPELEEDFVLQNDQIIKEDRVIFAAQQISIDQDVRGYTADDLKSAAPIGADEGLSMARRIIKKRLAQEAEAPVTEGVA